MIITAQDLDVVRELQRIADEAKERKPPVIELGLIKMLDKIIPIQDDKLESL